MASTGYKIISLHYSLSHWKSPPHPIVTLDPFIARSDVPPSVLKIYFPQTVVNKYEFFINCELKLYFFHNFILGKGLPLYSLTLDPLGQFWKFKLLNWLESHQVQQNTTYYPYLYSVYLIKLSIQTLVVTLKLKIQ